MEDIFGQCKSQSPNHQKEITCDDPEGFETKSLRKGVDIQFDRLRFSVFSFDFQRIKFERKQILHSVSGNFESGELSVIMGPSGAGKTTLLNILAGFTVKWSKGTVKLNGRIREMNAISSNPVAYIPQDEQLRGSLTVQESMVIAAHLKLGFSVTLKFKLGKINNILVNLGLEECRDTRVQNISGGQKKRLSIATELLHDPLVLVLDEPTTGLDSSSCNQCITLLKKLAREGKTVICTLHQPSALLFEKFDKLYVLADGRCIYDGAPEDLLPKFANFGLDCPPYHNPADFLIEVASGVYNTDLQQLEDAAKNTIEVSKNADTNQYDWRSDKLYKALPPNILIQFLLLTQRNFLISIRNTDFLICKILAHIIIAFIFGFIYHNVGNSAMHVLGNGAYAYGSVLLLLYTSQMSVLLKFPLEMKSLTIEHFNGWYKLLPYLLSTAIIEIPFQLACVSSYIVITYVLTGQPYEIHRINLVFLVACLMTLCAQSWGYFLGTVTPMKVAVFVGPVLICSLSVFGFCMSYASTPYLLKWVYKVSYFRAGFHNIAYAVLGMGRKNLVCPYEAIYCHYASPTKFLNDMGIGDVDYFENSALIIIITVVLYLLTFGALWFKLNIR